MGKINRFRSIKQNMTTYMMAVILLMTILTVYTLGILDRYKDQIQNMFERHIQLSEIQQLVTDMDADLLGFLSSKSSTRLNRFNINKARLEEQMVDWPEEIYNTEDMMLKNIHHLLEEYLLHAEEAISAKRMRNVGKYFAAYETSDRIRGMVVGYVDSLNRIQLGRNSKTYLDLVEQIRLLQNITYSITATAVLLSLLIVYLITSGMVNPLTHLSHAAEEIARGNFDTEDIRVESEDELHILADAFNNMKNSIGRYIVQIKEKAETEAQLKDQQLKNLKMEHLLDNARLYALQSQINPHFLFNTINAGVQMSIMERADRTGAFLESMARLFRYNIQKMDSVCTLQEEVDNIRDYHDLLKVRFGDLIRFDFDIDPKSLEAQVPPLILQPLVENAYIHGLSGLEEGGTIIVRTRREGEDTLVTVEDTGKGMDPESIREVMEKNGKEPSGSGHGIGMRNVRDRLELFYHAKDVFFMENLQEGGLSITIRIPSGGIWNGGGTDDQTDDRG
ncbi:sensor histidine kinase [Anaerotalea alkaliphila]|uniref:histidine kinase n=1 Tax=Anaerotalea alkaliphila TaxID=2662126 RepID=A0A7X5HV11_9FIRM|nr:histidine kinase [Anaerotalea alkaliphila]NDL67145.1 HAMP domain-containing protein [Anaerotalea alkaliphila]